VRGAILLEFLLVMTLISLFWVGRGETGGFAALCRGLSERLDVLQQTRERYDGSHP
jgi:hypothetical protein